MNILVEYDLDKNVFEEQTHTILFNLLKERLTPREFGVLRARYFKQWTFKQISIYYGFNTAERSRQIHAKALKKLRHPNVAKILKEYYAFI